MKRILFFSGVASVVALLSCSKDHNGSHGSRSVTIDTTIASGTQYVLDLKPYGDADDVATIKTQAATYTTSEIINTGTGFSSLYHFSAANTKESLSEQVVIAVTEGSYGRSRACKDSTLITINFKVQ